MAARHSSGGRPARHPGEILSKNRTFRCRDRLDEKLQELAAASGRTVSLEIERRLEDLYFRDRLEAVFFGSDVAGEILRLVRLAMATEGVVGLDWDQDPIRAEALRTAVNAIIAVICGVPLELPPVERRTEGLQLAKHLLLLSSVRRTLPPEIMSSDDPTADWDKASAKKEKRPTTSKRRKVGG